MRVDLTAKQQRFVEEYLVDLNATQAAIRAGYRVKDADKIGTKLLRNTRIKAAIDKLVCIGLYREGGFCFCKVKKYKQGSGYKDTAFTR